MMLSVHPLMITALNFVNVVKNNLVSATDQLILVTGACRSGKSEWAESLAAKSDRQVVYVATSQTSQNDPEWQARIEKHRQRRSQHWQVIEEPKNLEKIIAQAQPNQCLLIDSLGTWLANLLDLEAHEWSKISSEFMASLPQTQAQIILVAEETGWGLVPAYKSGRIFRDRLGELTRKIGTIADTTYLIAGGHVLNLSILGTPLEN